MIKRAHTIRLRGWQEFAQRVTSKELGGDEWYFRGGLPDWPLETSLERAFRDWHVPFASMLQTEKVLLREFKRAYRLSADNERPADDDTLGWLALMQHHGAPTRLLDWTYSPFVAAYFAMEALLARRSARAAVVWALGAGAFDRPSLLVPDATLLEKFENFRRKRDGASFRAIFVEPAGRLRFVFPVNPAKLNQRLIIQQGVFLCPTDLRVSFEDGLAATSHAVGHLRLVRLVLPRRLLGDAMTALHRMNMHSATLFPGLDGYARTFRSRLRFYASGKIFSETDV